MSKKSNRKPGPAAGAPRPSGQQKPANAAKPAAQVAGKKSIAAPPAITIKQLCAVLAVICIALYANTLRNGFALDDVMVYKENKFVHKGLAGIGELLTTPHMRGYLVIPNDLYRPLSLVMFAIEYQFFGVNAFTGHLFNILLFAGCVIMLFLFLNKLFGGARTSIAFIAAFVFAIHPIHTEVVANMKSSDELFCYLFGFLSLNIFMNYMRDGKMQQLILGTVVFFLALISKETVIAFLALIPLIFFFYNNNSTQRAAYITAGVFAATVIFLGIRSSVLSNFNANQSVPVEFIDNALSSASLSPASKFATELVVLGKYLKLMFIPYPLLSNYSFNAIPFADLGDYRFWLSLIAYGGLLYVAVTRFLRNHKDLWAFAIVFYLFTLFLFSNLPFLMGAELAERFAFFASTGVCIAAALVVERFFVSADASDISVLRTTKVLAVLIPLLVVFGGMTIARNVDWQNNYTLYKADVEKSPNDCRLHHFVATAITEEVYPKEKDTARLRELTRESIEELRKSLAIYPDYSEAHVELGRVFDRDHQWDSAEVHDRKALELSPNNSTATNNLGNVYLSNGKYPQAVELFKKSIALKPDFSFAYYNVGLAYMQMRQYDSAIKYFDAMLGFDPAYTNAHLQLGTIFLAIQRPDSAQYHFKFITDQAHGDPNAAAQIGMACFTAKKFDMAAVYFKQVVDANPKDINAMNNLGAAYQNSGQVDKAVALFQQTVTIDPNYVKGYSNLAHCYYQMKQYQATIDNVNKALSLDQRDVYDIPYLALCNKALGNMDLARKYEALAQKYYPNFKLDEAQ